MRGKLSIGDAWKDMWNVSRGTAVVFIGLLFALWAKLTGDLKPLAIFVIGVAGSFMIFSINYVLGKLNQ